MRIKPVSAHTPDQELATVLGAGSLLTGAGRHRPALPPCKIAFSLAPQMPGNPALLSEKLRHGWVPPLTPEAGDSSGVVLSWHSSSPASVQIDGKAASIGNAVHAML